MILGQKHMKIFSKPYKTIPCQPHSRVKPLNMFDRRDLVRFVSVFQ